MPHYRRPPPRKRQPGVVLFIVIILTMLSALLALWASRSALFNEMIVGNDADYQRAFEAAQALLQDAELDIRGEAADGSECLRISTGGGSSSTGLFGYCRKKGAADFQFPLEAQDVSRLLLKLQEYGPTQCFYALCTKRTGKQDFWNNEDASKGVTSAEMKRDGIGARYSYFTGTVMERGYNNPILEERSSPNAGGWYWIEVMPYDPDAGNSGLVANGSLNLALHLSPSVAYRITAIAHGFKPHTQVVLQQTYARNKLKD